MPQTQPKEAIFSDIRAKAKQRALAYGLLDSSSK